MTVDSPEYADDEGRTVYYAIERPNSSQFQIAEMIKTDGNGNLEYVTPDGRHGGVHHDGWSQFQQKTLEQIRTMQIEGVLTGDSQQFIKEILDRES